MFRFFLSLLTTAVLVSLAGCPSSPPPTTTQPRSPNTVRANLTCSQERPISLFRDGKVQKNQSFDLKEIAHKPSVLQPIAADLLTGLQVVSGQANLSQNTAVEYLQSRIHLETGEIDGHYYIDIDMPQKLFGIQVGRKLGGLILEEIRQQALVRVYQIKLSRAEEQSQVLADSFDAAKLQLQQRGFDVEYPYNVQNDKRQTRGERAALMELSATIRGRRRSRGITRTIPTTDLQQLSKDQSLIAEIQALIQHEPTGLEHHEQATESILTQLDQLTRAETAADDGNSDPPADQVAAGKLLQDLLAWVKQRIAQSSNEQSKLSQHVAGLKASYFDAIEKIKRHENDISRIKTMLQAEQPVERLRDLGVTWKYTPPHYPKIISEAEKSDYEELREKCPQLPSVPYQKMRIQ